MIERFGVDFRLEAIADVQTSVVWYEEQLQGLGIAFIHDLDSTISLVSTRPKAFQVAYRDLRRAPLSRFPFMVIYQFNGSMITVLRVFHTSRSPKAWRRKKS